MAITSPLGRSFDYSQSARFQQRVAVAALDTVVTVAGEPGATTNHANRLAFAAQVSFNPLYWANKMSFGIVAVSANIQTAITNNATLDAIDAAVADADIKTAVGVVWNFYADASVTLAGTTGSKVL